MKKRTFVLSFLAIILLIGFALPGCDTKTDETQSSKTNGTQEEYPWVQPKDTEKVVDTSIVDALFEAGIGFGVDALTASSPVGNLRKSPIFESSILTKENLGSYAIGSSRSSATSKETIIDEVTGYNAKLIYTASAEAELSGLFTAGFEQKFSLDSAVSSKKHIYQYYFIQNQYVVGRNYQLTDYTQPKTYQSKLSQNLLNDLQDIHSDKSRADDFFSKYGTHAVMAVSYGGMIGTYYSCFSKNTINVAEISTALTQQMRASFTNDGISGGASSGIDAALKAKYEKNDTDTVTALYVETIGGNVIGSNTFEAVASGYGSWVNSLNKPEKYSVIDVPDQGLVPIWYYFPQEYSEAATVLKTRFIEKATQKGLDLARKMFLPKLKSTLNFHLEGDELNLQANHEYSDDPRNINLDVSDLIAAGYIYVKLTVRFYLSAGTKNYYPYVYLYHGSDLLKEQAYSNANTGLKDFNITIRLDVLLSNPTVYLKYRNGGKAGLDHSWTRGAASVTFDVDEVTKVNNK
ncbi:hypothetical protein FACS1894211_13550 [Clostridia bacterium]|nr:hypothetical protein FACS1894211_13550 [Clostridia bacterium]